MTEYVQLICVGGPEDGAVLKVVKHFASCLLFPLRQPFMVSANLVVDEKGPPKKSPTAEYIIS